MQDKWIILTSTLCQGTIPAWFGDDGRPVVYDTQKAAYTEMLQEHIVALQSQLEDYKNDQRGADEIDFECQDWVEPCTISDDGCIKLESGEIYDPKTYVR
jgi:hypothetical protein